VNVNFPGFLPRFSKCLLELLEPRTLVYLLPTPGLEQGDDRLYESLRKLLDITLHHVSVLEHCPVYPYQGLEPLETILKPFMTCVKSGRNLSDSEIGDLSLITRLISKLKHISFNTITLKNVLEILNSCAIYYLDHSQDLAAKLNFISISLLAAANIIRQVPDLLYTLSANFFDISKVFKSN
jgi:hypothetical protein